MGKDVAHGSFSREDRARYRQKVRRCLDVFAMMLNDFHFDADRPTTGLEIELNLIDGEYQPAMRNAEVLANIADPQFQTELGQFNLEINVRPRLIAGNGFVEYESEVRASLAEIEAKLAELAVDLVLIGILPTLMQAHTILENLSSNPRYRVLNEQIVAARGEDIALDIRGGERLQAYTDSIAPEAACTSVQFHLQVAPEAFASYWNAAQAVAGVQVAVGANSPYLFGKQLWQEARIALFEQATDTRSDELKAQGVRPRVWFGERWITSIFDLFEENVRYFPPLLPICDDEDPVEVLHAGPTVVDLRANAAFYFGLVRQLSEADRPIWTRLPFSVAEENFHVAARGGIEASVWWPGRGEIAVTDLVLEKLLPSAYDGLDRFGVEPAARDRLLGIIEGRCLTRRNGSGWQTQMVHHLERERGLERLSALREMLRWYAKLQHTNEPVHTWPVE